MGLEENIRRIWTLGAIGASISLALTGGFVAGLVYPQFTNLVTVGPNLKLGPPPPTSRITNSCRAQQLGGDWGWVDCGITLENIGPVSHTVTNVTVSDQDAFESRVSYAPSPPIVVGPGDRCHD